MMALLRLLFLLIGTAPACGAVRYATDSTPDSRPDGPADRAPSLEKQRKYLVDLLFMVDNSNSMDPMQKALTGAFPRLVEGLKLSGGSLPDLHIGVVSSDLGVGSYSYETCEKPGGDGGKLHSTPGQLAPPGCPVPKDPWISFSNGITNISSGPADPVERVKSSFSCIASLGVAGCGFEQPLESVRRALDPALAVNPGFLRPDALLVVFFITNEDDCSANDASLFDSNATALGELTSYRCTRFGLRCNEDLATAGVKTGCKPAGSYLYPPADYVSFFSSLKPKGKVILAGLAGPTSFVKVSPEGMGLILEPTCQSINGSGVPALRLEAVITGLGGGSFFNAGIDASEAPVSLNVCNLDLDPALRFLAKKIVAAF